MLQSNVFQIIVLLLVIVSIPQVQADTNLRSHLKSPQSLHETSYYNQKQSSNPFVDFIFGFIFVFISIPILWYNERRQAINEYRLAKAEEECTSTNCQEINPNLQGKLIHTSGRADTDDLVVDSEFGLSEIKTVKILRKSEMYQWIEHTKTENNETRVTYSQEWSESFHDNNNGGYQHTNDMAKWTVKKQIYTNPHVFLGQYLLSETLKEEMCKYEKISLNQENIKMAQMSYGNRVHQFINLANDCIIFSQYQGQTQVGDLKISFCKVPCGDTTVISQQSQNTFVPWQFHDKFEQSIKQDQDMEMSCLSCCCCGCCNLIKALESPITEIDWVWEEMLDQKQGFKKKLDLQQCLTTVLRIIGYFVMVKLICMQGIGFCLIFSPISTIISWIPWLGYYLAQLTSFIFGVVSFTIAIPLTLIVVAFAWLWYHPKVGIFLLLIAGAISFGIYYYISHHEPQTK